MINHTYHTITIGAAQDFCNELQYKNAFSHKQECIDVSSFTFFYKYHIAFMVNFYVAFAHTSVHGQIAAEFA